MDLVFSIAMTREFLAATELATYFGHQIWPPKGPLFK